MRRVALDTNIWVSALIQPLGPSARIVSDCFDGRLRAVGWEGLLEELRRTLAKPRLLRWHGLNSAEQQEFLASVASIMELATVGTPGRWCRDPHDDMLIAGAVAAGAEVLITGDQDLGGSPEAVAALESAGIELFTPAEFIAAVPLVDTP